MLGWESAETAGDEGGGENAWRCWYQ